MSLLKYYNNDTHTLTLPHGFTMKLHNLPNSVIHIIFGDYFIENIDNLLNSIMNLTFGHNFN